MMKVPPTGDQSGECRAHGNLGSALFSKGSFREALANHRNQLVLAMKLKDREVCHDVTQLHSDGKTQTSKLLGSILIPQPHRKQRSLYFFLSTFIGSRKFPLICLMDHLKGRTVVQ